MVSPKKVIIQEETQETAGKIEDQAPAESGDVTPQSAVQDEGTADASKGIVSRRNVCFVLAQNGTARHDTARHGTA